MPAFAQFLLNLRKALSNVSFSLTITFDIVSHLTSPPALYCASYDCSGIFIALQMIITYFSATSTVFSPKIVIIFGEIHMIFLCKLLRKYLFCLFQCICNTCRILSTSLSHVWTTTAATAYTSCNCFDKITGMCSFFHSSICCHNHQAYFAIIT